MIGLFFGESSFPVEILKKIIKKKIKYKIIDLTKKKIFKKDKNSYSVSIGQFGKILKILKDNKCKKVLFAGKVNKPKLSKLKLDLKGVFYMPRIIRGAKLGDAAIIKEIINILKVEKIKVINSLFFNNDLSSISRFDGFTSTKITLPPDIVTALAVAGKEIFGTITSSPFLIPAAFKARNNATVPLLVATTYFTFKSFFNFFSNSFVWSPSFGKLFFKAFFIILKVFCVFIRGFEKSILFIDAEFI